MKKPFKYRPQQRKPHSERKDEEKPGISRHGAESRPIVLEQPPPSPPKVYKVLFYSHFIVAKADAEKITATCDGCDQLNVVIREEGNMDDPDLLGLHPKVKIFAGEAWNLIHERRVTDGWYNSPQ